MRPIRLFDISTTDKLTRRLVVCLHTVSHSERCEVTREVSGLLARGMVSDARIYPRLLRFQGEYLGPYVTRSEPNDEPNDAQSRELSRNWKPSLASGNPQTTQSTQSADNSLSDDAPQSHFMLRIVIRDIHVLRKLLCNLPCHLPNPVWSQSSLIISKTD